MILKNNQYSIVISRYYTGNQMLLFLFFEQRKIKTITYPYYIITFRKEEIIYEV